MHANLSIPVTAKFQVFPTVEKTVERAWKLERAGAQIITCHSRTREQRGHNTVWNLSFRGVTYHRRILGSCRLGPDQNSQGGRFDPSICQWEYSVSL